MKGKISSIVNKGTYSESGSYGNASFCISEDGTQNNELYCFRILYYENKKYESGQTDIKVGDEVIVCGKWMNYRNNTPETVSGGAYLVSLMRANNGGSSVVSFNTNSDTQTWKTATDGTYGSGYSTTTNSLDIGYYKYQCSSSLVAPNSNHIRIYKNSVLSIATTDGRKIKKIVINCAPNAGTTSYCFDMSGLEGCANAMADKSALIVTWNGSTKKVLLYPKDGQVRMEKITVELE